MNQHLGFFVGSEEYGVGILQVRELAAYTPVTRVPASPPFVRGVVNLRGKVVPVVNLSVRLQQPETPITKRTCIVILESDRQGLVGVLADSVSRVTELDDSEIEPPPAFGTRAPRGCLKGMGRVGQRFILLLDVDAVLDFDRQFLVEVPAEGAAPVLSAEEAAAAAAAEAIIDDAAAPVAP